MAAIDKNSYFQIKTPTFYRGGLIVRPPTGLADKAEPLSGDPRGIVNQNPLEKVPRVQQCTVMQPPSPPAGRFQIPKSRLLAEIGPALSDCDPLVGPRSQCGQPAGRNRSLWPSLRCRRLRRAGGGTTGGDIGPPKAFLGRQWRADAPVNGGLSVRQDV